MKTKIGLITKHVAGYHLEISQEIQEGSRNQHQYGNTPIRDIQEADNTFLKREATDEEPHQTINQLNPLKAPGPDGLHAFFYQTFWHILGKNIIRMLDPHLSTDIH